MTGYRKAREDGYDIAVKIDGDGQMDPGLIAKFVQPIRDGKADYTKGNRFYDLTYLEDMPVIRLFGNAVLSFMSKVSTGYWNLFDPTNGYTALHLSLLDLMPLAKISKRYFFESDFLFRLNIVRACVKDVPMKAIYADEVSHLKIANVLGPFFLGHCQNTIKRFFYSYILRDFQVLSLNIVMGVLFIVGGTAFGIWEWWLSSTTGQPATSGTVVLAALPILVGVQLVLSALNNDILNIPNEVIHLSLNKEASDENVPRT